MSDAELLETIAEFFDTEGLKANLDGYKIQTSLRRIAQRLREIDTI